MKLAKKNILSKNHKKHQIKKALSQSLNKLRIEINKAIDEKISELPKKDALLNIENDFIKKNIEKKYLKKL